MKLNLIAAACGPELGIGRNGTLPWRLREELKYFNRITVGDGSKRNAVLMGRKTWASIPDKMKPLKNRFNVILSRQSDYDPKSTILASSNTDDIMLSKSIEDAIESLKERPDISETIWVIGGSEIYASALRSELFHRIYLTKISTPFECDTFFPAINFDEFMEVSDPHVPSEEQREGNVVYKFKIYEKKKSN